MRQTKLYQETISDTLWKVLNQLMRIDLLFSFRLVGGTALSLQLGHRISVDIDLFTDSYYGSIDFKEIDKRLQKEFSYIEMQYLGNNSMGKSYYIGKSKDNLVKLDLFYTDSFIRPEIKIGHLRLGTIEEIAAMKLGVIENGGCKKRFLGYS